MEGKNFRDESVQKISRPFLFMVCNDGKSASSLWNTTDTTLISKRERGLLHDHVRQMKDHYFFALFEDGIQHGFQGAQHALCTYRLCPGVSDEWRRFFPGSRDHGGMFQEVAHVIQ